MTEEIPSPPVETFFKGVHHMGSPWSSGLPISSMIGRIAVWVLPQRIFKLFWIFKLFQISNFSALHFLSHSVSQWIPDLLLNEDSGEVRQEGWCHWLTQWKKSKRSASQGLYFYLSNNVSLLFDWFQKCLYCRFIATKLL